MLSREMGTERNQAAADSVLDKWSWHKVVKHAVTEAHVTNSQVAVIFIDVNHFKDVNDTLGHVAGDEVIDEIRKLLSQNLRLAESRPGKKRDLLSVSQARNPSHDDHEHPLLIEAGHIGGDEFGILCKTDEKGAQLVVERLRNAFSEYIVSQDERLHDLDISLAIGVSVLQPNMTSSELLYLADREMYEDKLRQLPPLDEVQEDFLLLMQEGLERNNLRLRDVGKYMLMLSRKSAG